MMPSIDGKCSMAALSVFCSRLPIDKFHHQHRSAGALPRSLYLLEFSRLSTRSLRQRW